MNNTKPYYKGIFLSMYCNDPFFIEEEEVIANTWAKELINGKYMQYTFFSFTACNEQHPLPCIEGHHIYVATGDNLYTTYSKNKAVFELLKENFNFDWIIRTNTSMFLNVKKIVDILHSAPNNYILAGLAGDMIFGNLMILPYWVCNAVFNPIIDEDTFPGVPKTDDAIISRAIKEYIPSNLYTKIALNYHPSGLFFYKYKGILPQDVDKFKLHPFFKDIIDDPEIVNKEVAIQVRSFYQGEERYKNRQYEYDHMRELYDAYKFHL